MNNSHEDMGHREAWELIPWLVNGRANASDRERLEHHLADCMACREELEFQQKLYSAVSQEAATTRDPQPGLDRLWARIDAVETPLAPPRRQRAGRLQQMLLAAVLVEGIGIAALSSVLWSQNTARAPYQTLSSPEVAPAAATIRMVLAPEMTAMHLQELLVGTGLQIVAGPTAAGVYMLGPLGPTAELRQGNVLAQLRTAPGVRFAEPVSGSTP